MFPQVAKDAPKPDFIGENFISTPDDEFGGALSNDGKTIYYDITVPPHYLYIMCESHLVDGQVAASRKSFPSLDSIVIAIPYSRRMATHCYSPPTVLAMALRATAFTSGLRPKLRKGGRNRIALDGPVNSEGSQVFASMALNGNLYFTSDRKNGEFDIYRSKLVDGKYQAAEDLGPTINGEGIWSLEALVAPDESYLLIGSFGRQPSFGNSDLFISYNQHGVWTKPKNLGPVINTPAREYSPRISPDGKWLIYTSEQGMQTEKRDHPFTAEEFSQKSRGIFNGLGNIYRIPLDYVLQETRP